MAARPAWLAGLHGWRALAAIADLKRIYGKNYDTHARHQFRVDDAREGPTLNRRGLDRGIIRWQRDAGSTTRPATHWVAWWAQGLAPF